MSLCKYKDIFGKPNEGVHSYRIFNVAVVDLVATLLGAYLISYKFEYKFSLTLLVLLIVATVLHLLFCVDTTVVKFIKKIV